MHYFCNIIINGAETLGSCTSHLNMVIINHDEVNNLITYWKFSITTEKEKNRYIVLSTISLEFEYTRLKKIINRSNQQIAPTSRSVNTFSAVA